MTTLEYMQRQLNKHQANLAHQIERGAPEKDIENIREKIAHYSEVVDMLINAVVRCRDCKIGFKKFVKGVEVIECQRHEWHDPKQYKHLDGFCSYGERREQE